MFNYEIDLYLDTVQSLSDIPHSDDFFPLNHIYTHIFPVGIIVFDVSLSIR